jgi:hypothetical protein
MSWNGPSRNIWLCCRLHDEMIPLLTTCCCGVVSVRSAALLVAALFIVRRLSSDSDAFFFCLFLSVSSSLRNTVRIATGYSLDGPGVESRWKRDFPCRPDRFQAPPTLQYNKYQRFPCRPDRFQAPPSLQYNKYQRFPGDKVAGTWRWPKPSFFSDRHFLSCHFLVLWGRMVNVLAFKAINLCLFPSLKPYGDAVLLIFCC